MEELRAISQLTTQSLPVILKPSSISLESDNCDVEMATLAASSKINGDDKVQRDDRVSHCASDGSGSDFDFSISEISEEPLPEDLPLTRDEELVLIHDQAQLDCINNTLKKLERDSQLMREEIKNIIGKISRLKKERDSLYEELQQAEETSNSASIYRLRAHHDRVCLEIDGDEDILDDIKVKLLHKEYAMNKVDVQRATYIHNHVDLAQRQKNFAHHKQIMAQNRMAKEEKQAVEATKAIEMAEREYSYALNQKQKKIQDVLKEANENREKVQKYINMSLAKMKKHDQEKNDMMRERLQMRMDMLLKLKADIATNRENIRALTARDCTLRQQANEKREIDRTNVIAQGLNADYIMIRQDRISEWECSKQQFETEQKSKQVDIISKLLNEDEIMKKKMKWYPPLFANRKSEQEKNLPEKPVQDPKVFTAVEKSIEPPKPSVYRSIYKDEDDEQDTAKTPLDSLTCWDVATDTINIDEKRTLNHPEFEGLWNEHKRYNVVCGEDNLDSSLAPSKMEKEILDKRLAKQRECIIGKQIAAGREFKGQAFYSKPDMIHFKDFDVGSSYKKRVILTNVSYSVNFCKFMGITELLKDFIHIHFDPPGSMSAGMTCDMVVTFKPMINEDLIGEVFFMAQTGPFSVPLMCTTKKCDLSLDTYKIDFGTAVIGETMKRSIMLTNKGAQGTSFNFCKPYNIKARSTTTPETSLGRMTTEYSVHAVSEPTEPNLGEQSQIAMFEVKEADGDGDLGEDRDVVNSSPPAVAQSPMLDEYHIAHEEDEEIAMEYDVAADDVDGMETGELSCGRIDPFSSVTLDIVWKPMIPGKVSVEFVVSFADEQSMNLSVGVQAKAIDVPVWVERETIDLRICMYDRLYQDTLIINNRATSALKLTFDVPKELKNHLEVLPKTGYIQAQAQFSVQLKFLPRKFLAADASKFFDDKTGVFEVPMMIRVADQTRPVPFTVTAIVTNSDLKFSVKNIDFGCATIYESVKTTIQLMNNSILPQQFGFVGLPDYVDVQPNDGFGTLLPLEFINIDIVFSPKKAGNYKFILTCKSLINRDFAVSCIGVGVHPPLELSHQVINLPATSLYDIVMTSVRVCNSHTSTNEFTHPVPRIGKGDIVPVGPTSFEFVIPDNCPVTISPLVGTVMPGHETRVEISFKPELNVEDIKEEAVRIAMKQLRLQAEREHAEQLRVQKEQEEMVEPIEDVIPIKVNKKAAPKTKKLPPSNANSLTVGALCEITPPSVESITNDSPAFWTAMSSLLRHHENQFHSYRIACYVASGKCTTPGKLKYSIHNTLYLDIHCPVIKPSLLVISNNGNTITDFKDICIGQAVTKSITIQNITNKSLQLTSSMLHTAGPFVRLNALRVIPPDGSHTIHISFTPTASEIFHEVLKVHTGTSTLYLTLRGRGVEPIINLSVDKILDVGAVLVGEYTERAITLENISSLSVNFMIQLDSLSLFCHLKSQENPNFFGIDSHSKFLVGPQNYNGQRVFDCVPCEGTILPGQSAEITVTFAPDHKSDLYSDFARIQLFGQEETYSFQLVGTAKSNIMYVCGMDRRTTDMESLAIDVVNVDQVDEAEVKPEPEPLLITLYSQMLADGYALAARQLFIGCVRTMAVSQKKSGEFIFDNIHPLAQKGFNIEPQKGMVDAGSLKAVTVTWMPTPDHDPNDPVETSIVVTLRGDITDQVRLIIRALVVS